MKKTILTLITTLFALTSLAQNKHDSNQGALLAKIDSTLQITNEYLYNNSMMNRYKLYPTENIYTLLQLDTKTGMVKQVQWSLDSDNEGTLMINDEDLSYSFATEVGSFELYPTKNMYQLILLDKTFGRMWHVQWGIGEKKRWIRRIH